MVLNPWFYEFGVPDLAIERVSQKGNKGIITVRKVGKIPTRVLLKVTFADGTTKEFNYSVKTWKDKNSATFEIAGPSKITEVKLGSTLIPDIDKSNNVWKISGNKK